MINIETQGLSKDYRTATGSYESIQRGNVSRDELKNIFSSLSMLSIPAHTDDDCPPAVLVKLTSDEWRTVFTGDAGRIACQDLTEASLSIDEAVDFVFSRYQSNKYQADKSKKIYTILFIVFILLTSLMYKYLSK